MKRSLIYVKNNWEALTFYTKEDGKEKEIEKLKAVVISDTHFEVIGSVVSTPYNDMGHTYSGTSMHYFVKIPLFGKKLILSLEELIKRYKIKVYVEIK